jgi:hypothetical protein
MIGRPKLNDAMLRQACIRSIPARGKGDRGWQSL